MFLGIFFYLLAIVTANSIHNTVDKTTQAVIPMVHINTTESSTTSSQLSPTHIPTLIPTPTNIPMPIIPIIPLTIIPTLTPAPLITLQQSNYESLFDQYSQEYGVDRELMKRIAKCESRINPGSKNGIYGGMFQFAEQTWISTRNQIGLDPNPDLRFSAQDAIQAAAFKISRGGIGAWRGCL